MEKKQPAGREISSAQTVLLGALAPGVNVVSIPFSMIVIRSHIYAVSDDKKFGFLCSGFQGPTWNTQKSTFLMLGLCLAAMLSLVFSSCDSSLILHVAFLVLIAVAIFLLLNWTRIMI